MLLNQRMNKGKLRHKEGPCVGEALSHLFFLAQVPTVIIPLQLQVNIILSTHWSSLMQLSVQV